MPTRATRKKIVFMVLAYCAVVITYIVAYGNGGNTLHQSALAWSFTLAGSTIAAYVFGAVWDNVQALRKK